MKVLVSDPLSPNGIELLREHVQVDEKLGLKEDELISIIGAYDALLVRSSTQVTAAVIEAGKQLKVIGRAGVGIDNINVEKATENGIIVLNVPGANTVSAAEHTLALLTSLARNIPVANNSTKDGQWNRQQFLGVELNQKTLGILGLGQIGSEMARRARALGMKVLAYDPYISAEHAEKIGVELSSLEELLPRADFITIHLPLGTATRGLIGAKEFDLMKQGGRLINCARGGIVDEDALYGALVSGKLAGAALDVFAEEPPVGSPLLQLDNVIVTPHLGALTREAQLNVSLQACEQVVKALRGEPLLSAVNMPVLLPETAAEVEPFLPLMRVLGGFYMQLFGGSIDEIEVSYSGEIAAMPLSPLTTSCLIGLLEGIVTERVTWVNAPLIAKNRGIRVRESSTATVKNYSSLVTLTVRDGRAVHTVSGTVLNQHDMRIVQIEEYLIEVVPTRYQIVTTHTDRPGVVGKVGTLLGKENINIASMQLGRKSVRGEALMVLQVDDFMTAETVQKVEQLDVISTARFVELPEKNLNPND